MSDLQNPEGKKRILIELDPLTGFPVNVGVQGVKGGACSGITANMLARMGGEQTMQATEEMSECATDEQLNTQLQ